eukprot:2144333-Prorocentrum_lima.AAC.1
MALLSFLVPRAIKHLSPLMVPCFFIGLGTTSAKSMKSNPMDPTHPQKALPAVRVSALCLANGA